jgi:hypothetical protein
MFSAFLPLVLASTILATPLARQDTRQYTVYNRCPTPIDLYIGGTKQATIPVEGNVVKTLGTGAGYFFTDANGGSQNANGTIRAGFYDVSVENPLCGVDSEMDEILQDYYYIISDPYHANTGVRVRPKDRSQPYVTPVIHSFPFTSLTCFGYSSPIPFVKRFNATGVVVHRHLISLQPASLLLHLLCRLRPTTGALLQTPIMR